MSVTLAQASIIVDTALAKARGLELHPLTVVVLDGGGHMVAMKREDASGILRAEIATGKAWGTLGMGFGGREFARRAAGGGAVFLQALMAASGGRIVPAPGGVLIRDRAGRSSARSASAATPRTRTKPARSPASPPRASRRTPARRCSGVSKLLVETDL